MDNSMTETFSIGMENISNTGGEISIEWAKIKVNVPFTVNTEAIVMTSIDEAVKKGEDLDKVYYKAASYSFKTLNDNKKAMTYLDQSFAVKKSHNAVFLKAQILKKEGKKDMAIKTAEEALKLAEAAEKKGWADYIKENIEEWKK
jgi:tetratricopeptide (TPR) repeat protein